MREKQKLNDSANYKRAVSFMLLVYAYRKSSAIIRGIIIVIVIFGFISSAHAFNNSELQWTQGISGKLLRGDVITYKEYSIEAAAFPPPVKSDKYREMPEEPVRSYVRLNISKNSDFISTIVLGPGELYIVPDEELKITVKELPSQNAREWLYEYYAPWAIIELNPRGKPDLKVSIDVASDKYTSSSATDIAATVRLENAGSADAMNIDLSIETGLQIKRGNLKYHYDRIKKGESITETIAFSSPAFLEQKTYEILANASGYDVKDISYNTKCLKNITIEMESRQWLILRKSVNNKIYLKDYAMISLSLKNNGNEELKNISITDYLPDSFKLVDNQTLYWLVDIPVGGEWDYRYLVKPQEPNKDGITLPSATAQLKLRNELYGVRSNQPNILVYGTKIILTKQTDISEIYPNETSTVITVTVDAKNTGNTPARVLISDMLPVNATVISGNTTYEDFLEADKNVRFNYSIKIDSGPPIKLPPANAEYYELGSEGEKINTSSEEIVIGIKAPAQTPLNVQTERPTPTISTPEPVTETITETLTTPTPTHVLNSIGIESLAGLLAKRSIFPVLGLVLVGFGLIVLLKVKL